MLIWSLGGFTFGRPGGLYNKATADRQGVFMDVTPKNRYDYEVTNDDEDSSGGRVHVADFRLVRNTQALRRAAASEETQEAQEAEAAPPPQTPRLYGRQPGRRNVLRGRVVFGLNRLVAGGTYADGRTRTRAFSTE